MLVIVLLIVQHTVRGTVWGQLLVEVSRGRHDKAPGSPSFSPGDRKTGYTHFSSELSSTAYIVPLDLGEDTEPINHMQQR